MSQTIAVVGGTGNLGSANQRDGLTLEPILREELYPTDRVQERFGILRRHDREKNGPKRREVAHLLRLGEHPPRQRHSRV